MLDPDGVTRTKALGSERMARKLRDALPGGEQPLRAALWAFMRPILSPRLVALNKDAFVFDSGVESSVDLDAHRADSDLDELDLGDDEHAAACIGHAPAGRALLRVRPACVVLVRHPLPVRARAAPSKSGDRRIDGRFRSRSATVRAAFEAVVAARAARRASIFFCPLRPAPRIGAS